MKNKAKIIHQLKQIEKIMPKPRKKKTDIEKRLDKIEEVLKRQFPREYCKHEFVRMQGTTAKVIYCKRCGYMAIIK